MTEEQKQLESVTTLPFHAAETEPNRSSAGIVVETLPGRLELRTNNPWEEICGHTRAVRRGPFVIVAGTTASDITVTGGVLHPESAYHQTVIIFERITNALLRMGAQITDIVRVRMFVVNIADQADVCRAFKETFHSYGIRVPATLVQVNAFVHPDMRIEIEADAIVL
ncbi:unnamed protein product [Rotaria magnacalcarata]|uniref:Uncharacterized protein n=1 Tax=Rotaria magnacalcarata TaxID=392030 RepID=A0A815TT55_9BILA|nr:unnamed protein product [Rotaria magnacalcarata]CAF1512680.1 unnamed protein product [Rotaria magnacalcarata]CAF2070899.1 unnamed protein product [Rotaria magnacalcarata]CAF2100934.1 unnamed protein product [Rotaria magnacalcarata]